MADDHETFYGAIDDGALPITRPNFVTKELEGSLDCGLLCRGFARVRRECAEGPVGGVPLRQ